MPLAIQHDRAAHHFEAQVDGVRCALAYTLQSGVMTITHTEVPSQVGGRGIASDLMRAAVTAANAEGWRVIPACSYASVWLQRHPEYKGLLA